MLSYLSVKLTFKFKRRSCKERSHPRYKMREYDITLINRFVFVKEINDVLISTRRDENIDKISLNI